MYHSAPLLLSLAASALAYSVTQPSAANPWTMSGPQTLSWEHVSTDPSTFTVVLTDMSDSYQQVLAAEVPGDLQSIMLNPPSGGWPQGEGFRLNLVQDVNHLNSILAQSSEYGIGVSNTPSGSSIIQTAMSPSFSTTSAVRPTSESSTFISSTFASSTVSPITATSSRSVAILPASSSAVTTSVSRATATTSSATSSPTALNAGSKTLVVHVGSIPFLVALSYLFM